MHEVRLLSCISEGVYRVLWAYWWVHVLSVQSGRLKTDGHVIHIGGYRSKPRQQGTTIVFIDQVCQKLLQAQGICAVLSEKDMLSFHTLRARVRRAFAFFSKLSARNSVAGVGLVY